MILVVWVVWDMGVIELISVLVRRICMPECNDSDLMEGHRRRGGYV